jgi:putative ABC transport system substrate-binding protein
MIKNRDNSAYKKMPAVVRFSCKKTILTLLAGYWLFSPGLAYPRNVAVVSSRKVPYFADAVNGIKKAFDADKNSAVIDIFYSEDRGCLAQLKAKKYDVICPLGVGAAKEIAGEFKDVAVVFSLVVDPVWAKIVPSMQPSAGNICGVSLLVQAQVQVAIIRKIVPGLRKVGIIYEGMSRSFYDELNSLDGLTIKAQEVPEPTKVPSAMVSFTSDNTGAFILVRDSDIYNKDSLAYVLNYTVTNKIPTMVFSSNMVKAGALMGFTYDYTDLGVQTGEMILGVLKGKLPAEIPVATPRKLGYALNVKIAGYIGMNIPRDAIDAAAEVYK